MLRSLKELERYIVTASDGDVGNVEDFLVEDRRWTVRYLVATTGELIGRRTVLLSPFSLRDAESSSDRFHVALTREQIRESPSVDAARLISRKYEREYFGYYGYTPYWRSHDDAATGIYPNDVAVGAPAALPRTETEGDAEVHVRSVNEVCGYHVEGSDAAVGHIADLIVDDSTWNIRYLVVDTSNWWLGKKVLVSPMWAKSVSWTERKVHLSLSRDAIKKGPEWNPSDPVNREYETRLYDYYGRPAYWTSELPSPKQAEAPARERSRVS